MSTIPLLLAAAASVGATPQTSEAPRSYVLDFTASWCGPCQQMSPMVNRLHREGHPIYKVDIEKRPELARKYRIRSIPAFVLVVNGREVRRLVGGQSERALRGLIAEIPPPPKPKLIAQPNRPSRQNRDPQSKSAPSADGDLHIRANNADADEPLLRDPSQPISMASSARIRVRDGKSTNLGSGTIIHSKTGRTIILTCGHILRDLTREARIDVDVFSNQGTATYEASILDADLDADLGLITIGTDRALPHSPVAPTPVREGEDVTSIGCGRGHPPTRMEIQVTALNRYLGPDNIECSGVPIQGRSGGGLFNRRGEVIGVCIAADPKDERGLYAGLRAIHDLLDRTNLTALYDPDGPQNSATASGQTSPDSTDRPLIKTVATPESKVGVLMQPTTDTRVMPESGNAAQAAPTAPPVAPAAPPVAPADPTVAPRMPEVADAEVVCIIRPRNGQGGPSRVVIINRASDKFVKFLTREVNSHQAPATRSHYPPVDAVSPNSPMSEPTAHASPVVKTPLAPQNAMEGTPPVASDNVSMTEKRRRPRTPHLVPATAQQSTLHPPERYRRSQQSRL